MHQIRLYLLCTVFMVLCLSKLSAQTVIGGDTIDQSAILDIQDTAKGVLLPRQKWHRKLFGDLERAIT